jgi:hypothetical protein
MEKKPDPTWLYKWIDSKGTRHITPDYHAANEALHNHCLVLGCRVPEPAPDIPFPFDIESDDEEEVFECQQLYPQQQ